MDKELKQCKTLYFEDSNYPERLKNISKPPKVLYYIGDISLLKEERIVAIVGTRKATSYGKSVCKKVIKDLVDEKIVTVSGLAEGIDTFCHTETLENNGKTIAVVGSGLDVIYPSSNRKLWEIIAKKGLLLSEFPLGKKAYPQHFPMRNRIIAGLSKAVIVIESKERGGSLITADLALEENRDVYAVPGEIFSSSSIGCNNLIKNSRAKLFTKVEELIYDYSWDSLKEDKIDNIENLEEYDKIIINSLEKECNLEVLIEKTGLQTNELLSKLMLLEIKGFIMSLPGGKYKKNN